MVLSKLVWPALARQNHSKRSPRRLLGFDSDDSDSKPIDEKTVKRIVTQFFLTPLYDLVDELYSIRSLSLVGHSIVSDAEYKTLDERFGETSEGFGEKQLNSSYTDMTKLEKEISIILYLLHTLIQEVVKYGSVTIVREYLDNIQNMKIDEYKLFQEIHEKRKMRDFLREAFSKERETSSSLIRVYNDSWKDIMSTLKNATELAQTEVKYINNWQKARYEQNKLKLASAEKNYSTLINQARWEIFQEELCHEEIQSFIEEIKIDYEDEINTWMDTYDTALEKKETDIYSLGTELEKVRDKYGTLKLEYDERAQEMRKWLAYKARKEEEEKLLEFQTWAVSKIQAWWRAVMVRKHLGSYKVLEGKRRDNKKKAKKNDIY